MKHPHLVNSIVLMICATALVFATQHVSRSEEKQKENIARLVGKNNATAEVNVFGPVHPTTITFEGFDGEVIWIANVLPPQVVQPNSHQIFEEVGRTDVDSSKNPDQVLVPEKADGYIKRSFVAPFNQ